MESILTSIKKSLGIDEAYEQFDPDIIMLINSALVVLTQIGIGGENFSITDKAATWADFISSDTSLAPGINLAMIKSYIYLTVRLIFDPPQVSALLESMKQVLRELEWRINTQYDVTTS